MAHKEWNFIQLDFLTGILKLILVELETVYGSKEKTSNVLHV